jgi:hypothetical protein
MGFRPELAYNVQSPSSFDLTNLVIRLAVEPEKLKENLQSTLDDKEIPELAHEITHFFQTTMTLNGIRLFILTIDSFATRWWLLKQAALVHKGELLAPAIINLPSPSHRNEEMKIALREYGAVLATRLYHYGGWHQNPKIVPFGEKILDKVYMFRDFHLLGRKFPGAMFFMDLRPFGISKELTAIGALQLREGSAMAVEAIQDGFINEEKKRLDFHSMYNNPIGDPYGVCNVIYTGYVHLAGCEEQASLEEFIVLVDLALMGDSIVVNLPKLLEMRQKMPAEEQGKLKSSLADIDFSPGNVFFHTLNIFAERWRKLNRLESSYSQTDIVDFENALQEERGSPRIGDIMANCECFLENNFESYIRQVPLMPKAMIRAYKEIFSKSFRYRHDILKGGALLIDLLSSKERILKIISDMPAIMVGPQVRSRGAFRPGEGIGVDMLNIQMLHDVTEALVTGDRICPLYCASPRECGVKPNDSCLGISHIKSGSEQCSREQALHLILDTLQVKRLRWRNR